MRKSDSTATDRYIPALRFRWLTPFYDAVVGFGTRERTFKRLLLEQADLAPKSAVLDLACGTGTLTIQAKLEHTSVKVVGLDGDPEILTIARRKAAQSGLEIEFEEGLSYALPFADESFDRVLSSLFFHHLQPDQKVATLVEVMRVLRPGGELHIADWGAAASPLARLLFYPVQILDGFSNTSDHVAGRIPAMLSAAGFEAVEVHEDLLTIYGTLSLFSCRKSQAPAEF